MFFRPHLYRQVVSLPCHCSNHGDPCQLLHHSRNTLSSGCFRHSATHPVFRRGCWGSFRRTRRCRCCTLPWQCRWLRRRSSFPSRCGWRHACRYGCGCFRRCSASMRPSRGPERCRIQRWPRWPYPWSSGRKPCRTYNKQLSPCSWSRISGTAPLPSPL